MTSNICNCGKELNYSISLYITTERRVCSCGQIHWVEDNPIDWAKVNGSGGKAKRNKSK